jgi:hypothetical protein
MAQLHGIVALVLIAVNALAGAVGVVYYRLRAEPPRGFAHLLALGQVLLIGQSAIGLLLLSGNRRAPDRLHYLYGALALAAVLSPWLYAPPGERRRLLWFAGAALLAAALSVRAYLTGS